MAELQDLLALLHGQSGANNNPPPPPPHAHQQPSVSSPIFSPSPSGSQPHHQSAIMSPSSSATNTPGPDQAGVPQQTPQQQSTQLLNLLRFNSQPSVAQARRPSQNTQSLDTAPAHGHTVSASDLVAGFAGGKATQPPAAPPASSNQQELLMRLLNQPKPAQTDSHSSRASAAAFSPPPVASQMPETAVSDVTRDLAAATLNNAPTDPTAAPFVPSPMRVFGSEGPGQSQFEPEPPARSGPTPRFTYRNPFEQLEAVSPRNRTPAPESSTPPASKMEILKPKHGLEGSSSSGGDDKSQSQAKYRKLSPSHETVAEAVSDLGEQVDKEIKETLAEVTNTAQVEVAPLPREDVEEIEEAVVETASEIKKELEDDTKFKALEKEVSKPIAASLQQVANDIVQGDVADSWESAEDNPAKEEDQTVIVYRFPMRAFASITVQDLHKPRIQFPPDLIMDVARLKKEFDQIDRCLVTASKNFIVYAIVKKGGFRIIRQENGDYRQVFEHHQERLFNVALCVGGEGSSLQSVESVLGIGVNGTVFWASVDPLRDSEFDEFDKTGLVLPPSPSQDDNTSGGQLKTRAKPSSRHPEFFAIGRGKAIHIIWPRVASQPEYLRSNSRIVHTEKYYKERSLKILTGKAGKDFTFSEDDTVIVSLDKAGRMRFWDIRPLIDPEVATSEQHKQIEVSETMLEFHTTSANAKSWPTSVFFFDKDKPFNKGIALRYVMVGMKQNHAFQLWDLALGKAVQEINLPHEKESDAICSVGFHPRTGIMAVAHPTRNSIFFVHVSCPVYNLPLMNQALYISRIANKSTDRSHQLPPVNATAIMTSITEYSFASKGQIRSLHMLNEPAGPADADDPENTALFELYVMHSKGVCTLRIRGSDLGRKREGEYLHPKKAQDEGVITITTLKAAVPPVDDSVTSGETPGQKSVSDRSAREVLKKESNVASRQSMTPEAAMRASTLAKVESKQDAARAAIINGGEKSEKKKKKRSTAETASQLSAASRGPPPPSYAQAAQSTSSTKSSVPDTSEASSSKASEAEAPEWAKKLVGQLPQQSASSLDMKVLGEAVQAEISKGLSQYTDTVYKRLDDEKRVNNAQNRANQEAILRLVSSTLTENVEGVIRKMVDQNMREVLLPNLLTQTSSTLEKNLGNTVKAHLGSQLAKEVPEAVSRVLKSPQVFQALSDQVAKKVTSNLEQTLTAAAGSVINPAVANLTNIVEHKISDQLRHAQGQHRDDVAKIHQLTDTVQTCLQTIQAMAASQAELQNQVAKLQQHLSQSPRQAPVVSQPAKQKTPEEIEAQEILDLLTSGKYEQGTMQWVQSPNSNELFDTVFIKCNPAYLSQISPLLILSTGAVVTTSLQENLVERLAWLDTVLRSIDPNDPEIHDVVPKIMEVIKERLHNAYMRLNESSPGDFSLRRIATLTKRVSELVRPSYPSSHVGSYVSRA